MKFQLISAVAALATFVVAEETALEPRALPLVQSNQLRRVLLRSEILKKAEQLQALAYSTPQRNRAVFTPGHKATTDWIFAQFEALSDYYTVKYHEFVTSTNVAGVELPTGYELAVAAIGSGAGKLTGEIVAVPNLGCDAVDYAGLALQGKIALIQRGICSFLIKTVFAQEAGAAGVILYNNAPGTISPTLNATGIFPITLMIQQAPGIALAAALKKGPITATIEVAVVTGTTYNVIAETIAGDHDNVVLSGGHSDSVPAGPGINDDGSGIIGLLEIAKQLTAFSVNNAVRFAFWSAEEIGLVGSTKYVESLSPEELSKIAVYLNFDMIASPNFVYAIYDGDGSAFNLTGPPGSGPVEKLFEDYFTKDAQLNHVPTAFTARSDYKAFADAGVPVGGLFTGAEQLKTAEEVKLFGGKEGVAYDINYHAVGDTVKNCNIGAWIQNSKAAAHAIATYARSLEGLGLGKREEHIAKRSEWKQEYTRDEEHHAHDIGGGCGHLPVADL